LRPIISTGAGGLDELLNGGLLAENMHLVFGEAESGKTTLAIQCAVNCARIGYKTIYIDTEGTFSPKRLAQIASENVEEIASCIILARPSTFREQGAILDKLDEYVTEKVGLIVVDTVTALYSSEVGGEKKKTFKLNRELSRQMAYLAQIIKGRKVPSLITSQVRSVFMADEMSVEPPARRVLDFWSDVVISLRLTSQSGVVRAVLEKHPRKSLSQSCFLRIGREGILDHKYLG